MADIRVKRGTRAQLDAAEAASGLAAGEPYLITDEDVLAVGTAVNAYVDVGPADLAAYLPLSGGTMSGDLNMGTSDIVSVSDLQSTDADIYLKATNSGTTPQNLFIQVADQNGTLRTRLIVDGDGNTNLYDRTGTLRIAGTLDGVTVQGILSGPADPTAGTHVGDRDYNDARYIQNPTVMLQFSIQDTLATGTGSFRLPITTALTVQNVRAMVGTAPTGASIIFDVNKSGTTLFTGGTDRPTITAGTNDSGNETPAVTACAAGTYLTVDVDQVGSTVAGADAVIVIEATVD